MNIKSYIAASVVASIAISASSVAMADDTYYLKSDCPAGGKRNFYLDNGKVNPDAIDNYGFARCNCTSYVADKIAKSSDISFKNAMKKNWSNASNWKAVAVDNGYVSDTTPKVGDIAWWAAVPGTALASGHVAYVESINKDNTVNVSEYNWNTPLGYGTRNNINAVAYLRKSSGTTTTPAPITLSSVGVTCPSSVWDFDNSAGTCSAKAYYSDNSNKSVTANSWGNGNSTAASINNGVISTKDVSKDTKVEFTATYTEGAVSKTSPPASVSVKDLPDGSDPGVFCKSDAITADTQTVYNKSNKVIGEVQLRYSPSCKAAWGKISLEKASNKKPQSVITTVRTRSNVTTSIASEKTSDKITGEIYSNLALLRLAGDKVCAIGTIDGFAPSKSPCKSF